MLTFEPSVPATAFPGLKIPRIMRCRNGDGRRDGPLATPSPVRS